MSLKLPSDYAAKIAEALNWKLAVVHETFTFEEDKQGFFWAKLKPKKFLDTPDFQTVCRLTRELGGEDYLKGARAWKIPGQLAKKDSQEKSSVRGIDSETAYKEARNAIGGALGQPKAPSQQSRSIQGYTMIPISALFSMPFQSRVDIEGPDFADLVESIRTVGILHPLLVREKANGLYEIVAGERRRAAAKKAALVEVPAIVKILTDREAYEIQLVENIQRKDLTDMEKAHMLDMMIKKFGYLQKDLAKKLGKNEGWVSRHLAMLRLETNILAPGQVCTGEVTERQAREILTAPEEKREQILDKINETGKVPPSREIHEIAHPEEKSKLLCTRCGFPIEGTPVHLGDGKYYDAECAEQEVAESKKGLIPESRMGPIEEGTRESEETSKAPEIQVHEGTSYDVADFTCPQCHQSFRIVHLPSGKHSFKPVREA